MPRRITVVASEVLGVPQIGVPISNPGSDTGVTVLLPSSLAKRMLRPSGLTASELDPSCVG